MAWAEGAAHCLLFHVSRRGREPKMEAHKHMARLPAGIGPWHKTEDCCDQTLLREAAAGHQTEQPCTHQRKHRRLGNGVRGRVERNVVKTGLTRRAVRDRK